jgi:hypothetical protein
VRGSVSLQAMGIRGLDVTVFACVTAVALTSGLACGGAASGVDEADGADVAALTRGFPLTSVDPGVASFTAHFTWPIPEGWVPQGEALPPPWDATFPFIGAEELRFPPGWVDPASDEWWSYDFLIWIDSGPEVTAGTLEGALVSYYSGLVECATNPDCDPNHFAARLRRLVDTPRLDLFAGSVDIFDLIGTPITLNLLMTSLVCPESNHRAVLVSASPLPRLEPMWAKLIDLQLQFRCR